MTRRHAIVASAVVMASVTSALKAQRVSLRQTSDSVTVALYHPDGTFELVLSAAQKYKYTCGTRSVTITADAIMDALMEGVR